MTRSIFALRRSALLALSLLLAIVLAACSAGGSGDGSSDGGPGGSTAASAAADGGSTATVSGGTVEVTAADLAFNVETIVAPAGEAFTVSFTNNEAVPHNFSLYTEEGGEAIATGNIIDEGEADEVSIDALEPGEYFFVCDVHPTEMTGTLVVEG